MNALPPSKTPDDKYYIGFFDSSVLIAVKDLILSYPESETAFSGFFMTDREHQSKGIGSDIIRSAACLLKAEGFQKIRPWR